MKIIVYSANINNYDNFNTPKKYDGSIRYLLFTDNKYFNSNVWEICHTDFINKKFDKRRIARYIKINPHLILPPHDVSIWVDHCIPPKFSNSNQMLIDIGFLNSDIMCYKHDMRKCSYDEAKEIKKQKLDFIDVVNNQMLKYEKEGFPKNQGLYSTGFIIRKNNEKVVKFNELWWEEVKNHSARDQLSQVYSAWKCGVKIDNIKIGVSVYSNPFLNDKIPHPKKWTI